VKTLVLSVPSVPSWSGKRLEQLVREWARWSALLLEMLELPSVTLFDDQQYVSGSSDM